VPEVNTGLEVDTVVDGRYRILGPLGSGGMASVYRAEHIGIQRQVALKSLHDELRGVDFNNERMIREALATGRLDHPNCVKVTDSGALGDGTPYLIMELLEGRSLRDALDVDKSYPPLIALHIARHVLQGLVHAHSLGVVHRDLKPANIFLLQSGADHYFAKLLDFGIAKLIGDAREQASQDDLTQEGMAIGSPTYMAPEQITENPIDPRTDLYSLSVVLYEILTGDPPFFDESKVRLLKRRLEEEPAPIATVPPSVDVLVRKGLARDPQMRYQNGQEYIAAIDQVLHELAPPRRIEREPDDPSAGNTVRTWIIGGLVAQFFLALLLIALISGGEDSDEEGMVMDPEIFEKTSDDPEENPRLDAELDRLEEAVAAGKGGQARQALAKIRRRWPENVRANYLLGLAYMEIRYWRDGFSALRKAIELNESLREDEAIIKAAIRSLTSRSKPELGERFLRDSIGEPARPYLEETASGGTERQRDYARRVLNALDNR
jgi:serine/threonine-protein kinase